MLPALAGLEGQPPAFVKYVFFKLFKILKLTYVVNWPSYFLQFKFVLLIRPL